MKPNETINLINKGVRDLYAYHLTPIDTDIKLNQNENPFDWPLEVKEKTAEFIKERPWNRYPDFIPDNLKDLVSKSCGLKKENTIVGNGSNEMLLVLMSSFGGPNRKVIITEPTFTVYKLLASGFSSDIISVPLKEDLTFDIDALKSAASSNPDSFMIICSPNNPTGCSIEKSDLEEILSAHKGILLLDQAYVEFGGYNGIELLEKYSNLIITRTFSKALGGAGLRIGYMFGNSEVIGEINKIKLPYNIDFITEHAAIQILSNPDYTESKVEVLKNERKKVYNFLKTLPLQNLYPSSANFICIRTDRKDELFNYLKEKDILTRDVSSYPMLDNCMRISIGTEEENNLLINELKLFFKNSGDN